MFLHKTKSIHFLEGLLPEYTLTWPSGHTGKGVALFHSKQGPSIGFSFWGRPLILDQTTTEILWIFPFFHRYRKKSAYLLRKKKKDFSLYHSLWIETKKKKYPLPLLRITLNPERKNSEQEYLSKEFCQNSYYFSGDATDQLQNPRYFDRLQRKKTPLFVPKISLGTELFLWIKNKLDATSS